MKRYLERAHQIQGRRSISVQHTPWQGGSADYSQGRSQFETLCHFQIASLNMRGRTGGGKAKMHRIAALTAQLKIEVVHMAALSEPRGPLGQVTQDTYFSGLGLASLTQWLSLLPRMFARHVNRSLRHIWVDIQASTEAPPILCLAVYGLHKLVGSSERLAFWRQCVQDFNFLCTQVRWRNSGVTLAGDTNVHSPYFSGNQQYVGVVERRVQDTITVQLGAQFHSLPDVPTHKSGTSLNRIAFSPQLHADVGCPTSWRPKCSKWSSTCICNIHFMYQYHAAYWTSSGHLATQC